MNPFESQDKYCGLKRLVHQARTSLILESKHRVTAHKML